MKIKVYYSNGQELGEVSTKKDKIVSLNLFFRIRDFFDKLYLREYDIDNNKFKDEVWLDFRLNKSPQNQFDFTHEVLSNDLTELVRQFGVTDGIFVKLSILELLIIKYQAKQFYFQSKRLRIKLAENIMYPALIVIFSVIFSTWYSNKDQKRISNTKAKITIAEPMTIRINKNLSDSIIAINTSDSIILRINFE